MIRRLILFLFSLTVAFGAEPPSRPNLAELQRTCTELAPQLVDATVAIMLHGNGSGSGVIVSEDGLVISAAHVTAAPGQEVSVLLNDGRELPALTLGVDHGTDGSLLQITAPGPFPFRPYIKEKSYQVGDWVLCTGHPGGPVLGRPAPIRLGQIIAAGTKSGFADPIVTTATVISGDSGGPLFNLDGEVIGINSNIGMPWTANQHVPLPAIVAKWDALLDSQTFGGEDNVLQQLYPYDDPYKKLREEFQRTLAEHPEHPFYERPRSIAPWEMQEWLDHWKPETIDPSRPHRPWLGFRLDLTRRHTAIVSEVEPNSPADTAGLKNGVHITQLNDEPIENAKHFSLSYRELPAESPVSLTLAGGQKIEITPVSRPKRRHFPMPLAGLAGMAIQQDAKGIEPETVRDIRQTLLEDAPKVPGSWVAITREGEVIVHATVVDQGELLTKLSELGDLNAIDELRCRVAGKEYPVSLIGFDRKNHDLALLSTKAPNLQTPHMRLSPPRPGSLTFIPTDSFPLLGCVTQPIRPAPKPGYEHAQSSQNSGPWMGLVLTPENESPEIAGVEAGSPADIAGILEGDLITQINGRPLAKQADLRRVLKPLTAGEKITLTIRRGSEEKTIRLILGVQPPPRRHQFNRPAALTDHSLKTLSARGGELSERRTGFTKALYLDHLITPKQAGLPVFDDQGRLVGITIARSYRHRTLAIPSRVLYGLLWDLRK